MDKIELEKYIYDSLSFIWSQAWGAAKYDSNIDRVDACTEQAKSIMKRLAQRNQIQFSDEISYFADLKTPEGKELYRKIGLHNKQVNKINKDKTNG